MKLYMITMLSVWLPSLNGFFAPKITTKTILHCAKKIGVTNHSRAYTSQSKTLPHENLEQQVAYHLHTKNYEELFSLLQTTSTPSKRIKDSIDQEFNLLYSQIENAINRKMFHINYANDIASLEKKIDVLMKSYIYLRSTTATTPG